MTLLPTAVYQAAFALSFLCSLVVVWTVCKIIHLLPGLGDKRKRHEYCIATASLGFKHIMLQPCSWMKLHGLDQLEKDWTEVSKSGAPYIIANHNSKLDSLLATALLPTWVGPKMRSLIKEALFAEPLFGGICESVGHFPVYFKGSSEGKHVPTSPRSIVDTTFILTDIIHALISYLMMNPKAILALTRKLKQKFLRIWIIL